MSSENTLYGYRIHLVLEDENGAFEVLVPFSNEGAVITVNALAVLDAINERATQSSPPRYREVKFDV